MSTPETPEFETLDQMGFRITDTSIDYSKTMLMASFGSEYELTAIIGLPAREWSIEITVLPALDRYSIIHPGGRETRADYLWNFYCRQMNAGNRSFWIRDFKDGRSYLVKFVDLQLTYQVFTTKLFSAALKLRQRRVKGVEGVSAPEEAVNPDQI